LFFFKCSVSCACVFACRIVSGQAICHRRRLAMVCRSRLRWGLAVLVALSAPMLANAEAASPVAIAISVMLLGSIGFIMMIFYLTNHPDEDIRTYSWQVLSMTISIFCSVLMFQACNGVVTEYIGDTVLINMVQLITWLGLLQLVLAKTSGAIDKHPKSLRAVELDMKCWAVLFAHLTGFSSINAWGSIQQTGYFSASPSSSLLVLPLQLVGLFAVFHILDGIRWRIANSDDGEVDEYEEAWDEEAEESENDVAGLSLSFLTVQALRFKFCGILPNAEGVLTGFEATHVEVYELLLCGILFAAGSVVVLWLATYIREGDEKKERFAAVINNYCSMGFAWCVFYGTKWWISSLHFTNEETLLRVVLALVLSAGSFLFIFFLDKLEDNELLGKDANESLEVIIEGLGILVGFSWEQSFDVAVEDITTSAKSLMPPSLSRLLMSIVLIAVVLPAWRYYILPKEQLLKEVRKDEGKHEKEFREGLLALQDQFFNKRAKEQDLDMMHLQLKQMRRDAHEHHGHHHHGGEHEEEHGHGEGGEGHDSHDHGQGENGDHHSNYDSDARISTTSDASAIAGHHTGAVSAATPPISTRPMTYMVVTAKGIREAEHGDHYMRLAAGASHH